MAKKVKRQFISLTFTIVREAGVSGPTYMLRTESADGRSSYRAVRPTWTRVGEDSVVTAHDAIAMANEDLWAAVMGANL